MTVNARIQGCAGRSGAAAIDQTGPCAPFSKETAFIERVAGVAGNLHTIAGLSIPLLARPGAQQYHPGRRMRRLCALGGGRLELYGRRKPDVSARARRYFAAWCGWERVYGVGDQFPGLRSTALLSVYLSVELYIYYRGGLPLVAVTTTTMPLALGRAIGRGRLHTASRLKHLNTAFNTPFYDPHMMLDVTLLVPLRSQPSPDNTVPAGGDHDFGMPTGRAAVASAPTQRRNTIQQPRRSLFPARMVWGHIGHDEKLLSAIHLSHDFEAHCFASSACRKARPPSSHSQSRCHLANTWSWADRGQYGGALHALGGHHTLARCSSPPLISPRRPRSTEPDASLAHLPIV
ncbi:hypothetical protein QBC47DRAFT_35169 [Echria macrotheca]|uniref:Uncharacterized protein n=1 Tax=Echria macrotheca TaxID=438768 RepID=A0AAJ0BB64_9PEZI|nr:hypothetical protein QBC47DRAFT_35169 [Echria macrotheca]